MYWIFDHVWTLLLEFRPNAINLIIKLNMYIHLLTFFFLSIMWYCSAGQNQWQEEQGLSSFWFWYKNMNKQRNNWSYINTNCIQLSLRTLDPKLAIQYTDRKPNVCNVCWATQVHNTSIEWKQFFLCFNFCSQNPFIMELHFNASSAQTLYITIVKRSCNPISLILDTKRPLNCKQQWPIYNKGRYCVTLQNSSTKF